MVLPAFPHSRAADLLGAFSQFFAERRLRHQLRLAGRPELSEMGNRLADNLGQFFDGVEARTRRCRQL